VVTGEKNSPTVAHACRKRRLKWVLGAWGLDVGLTTPPRKKSAVRKPKMWPRTVRSIRDDWEKSIKEAKVRIGL
jgi:hypothetical protein